VLFIATVSFLPLSDLPASASASGPRSSQPSVHFLANPELLRVPGYRKGAVTDVSFKSDKIRKYTQNKKKED